MRLLHPVSLGVCDVALNLHALVVHQDFIDEGTVYHVPFSALTV